MSRSATNAQADLCGRRLPLRLRDVAAKNETVADVNTWAGGAQLASVPACLRCKQAAGSPYVIVQKGATWVDLCVKHVDLT